MTDRTKALEGIINRLFNHLIITIINMLFKAKRIIDTGRILSKAEEQAMISKQLQHNSKLKEEKSQKRKQQKKFAEEEKQKNAEKRMDPATRAIEQQQPSPPRRLTSPRQQQHFKPTSVDGLVITTTTSNNLSKTNPREEIASSTTAPGTSLKDRMEAATSRLISNDSEPIQKIIRHQEPDLSDSESEASNGSAGNFESVDENANDWTGFFNNQPKVDPNIPPLTKATAPTPPSMNDLEYLKYATKLNNMNASNNPNQAPNSDLINRRLAATKQAKKASQIPKLTIATNSHQTTMPFAPTTSTTTSTPYELRAHQRTYEPRCHPPSNFTIDAVDPSAAILWSQWLEEWSNYELAAQIDSLPESRKINYFLCAAGSKVLHIYNHYKNTNDTLNDVKQILKRHFVPQVTPAFNRIKLRQELWHENETVDDYVSKIKTLASMGCDYSPDEEENIIRDLIIEKCADKKLTYFLFNLLHKHPQTSLLDVITTARNHALINQQIAARSSKPLLLNAISSQNQSVIYTDINAINKQQNCKACGEIQHKDYKDCKAKGVTCSNKWCGKKNHFANMCFTKKDNTSSRYQHDNKRRRHSRTRSRSRRRGESKQSDKGRRSRSRHQQSPPKQHRKTSTRKNGRSSSGSMSPGERERRRRYKEDKHLQRTTWLENFTKLIDNPFKKISYVDFMYNESASSMSSSQAVFAIKLNNEYRSRIHGLQYRYIEIGGTMIDLMIDTGSTVNLIDEQDYNKLIIKPTLYKPTSPLTGYGTTKPIDVIGCFTTNIKFGNYNTTTEFYVTKGKYGSLLAGITTERLHITNPNGHNCKHCNMVLSSNEMSIQFLTSKYPLLFDDSLGCVKNFEARIFLDQNVRPIVMAARPLPFHLKEAVEKELNRMILEGIIEFANGPTTWLSAMVIVHKDNGSVRICTDGRAIKSAIKRERHPLANITDIKHIINGAQYFSKIDLKSGYHQVMLEKSSRQCTAFQTPLGIMRYKRLNMGISCSSEIFQKVIQDILSGIPNQINISDDILIFAADPNEHDRILHLVLSKLQEHGLTVNTTKCEFKKTHLIFFGMMFSKDGIAPDPSKVDTIRSASAPTTYDELSSFLGLGSFLQAHIQNFSTISEPLWSLAKSKKTWHWNEIHQSAFTELKEAIATKANSYFNPEWDTTIIADASGVGLGAVLIQTDPKNPSKRHIVECASRLLSETERRYNHVEKEALASVWACEKFHIYVFGKQFHLITDNKAVELIYKNYKSKPPARIQRWALRLTPYEYTIQHESGKLNIADYLSRRPNGPDEIDNDISLQLNRICYFISSKATEIIVNESEIELDKQINLVTKYYQFFKTISIDQILTETNKDSELMLVKAAIYSQNFENKIIIKYKELRNELWVTSNGVLMKSSAIIIPKSLQNQIIGIAHEAHQGISGTLALLKHKIWFHGITTLVKHKVSTCDACQMATPQHIKPDVIMTPMPEKIWSHLAMDFYGPLMEDGSHVLVLTDLYSRFVKYYIIKSVSGEIVIPILIEWFRERGFPAIIKTDNGAPFNSKAFEDFVLKHNIIHKPVTPYWSRANGQVERLMKTLTKCRKIANVMGLSYKEQISVTIASYNNTIHPTTNTTPSSLIYKHEVNLTRLPQIIKVTKTNEETKAELNDYQNKKKISDYANQNNKSRTIAFKQGDLVRMKINTQESKNKPLYELEPFTITNLIGNQATIENKFHLKPLIRNTSQLIHYHGKDQENTSNSNIQPENKKRPVEADELLQREHRPRLCKK